MNGLTHKACDWINSNSKNFILVCADRAFAYSTEDDSTNDGGEKAVDSFNYGPWQLTDDEFAECCIDIGVEWDRA